MCVYTILDPFEFLVKIGYSENPIRRMCALSVRMKRGLILLNSERGGKFSDETNLHQRFYKLSKWHPSDTDGASEWFMIRPSLCDWLINEVELTVAPDSEYDEMFFFLGSVSFLREMCDDYNRDLWLEKWLRRNILKKNFRAPHSLELWRDHSQPQRLYEEVMEEWRPSQPVVAAAAAESEG